MSIIGVFFQRHRVRLPVTMGYTTRDVRAEIANGRLAMMDVIGMNLCDPCMEGAGQILGSGRVQVETDTGVASPHGDAEARPHLHARSELHDARDHEGL